MAQHTTLLPLLLLSLPAPTTATCPLPLPAPIPALHTHQRYVARERPSLPSPCLPSPHRHHHKNNSNKTMDGNDDDSNASLPPTPFIRHSLHSVHGSRCSSFLLGACKGLSDIGPRHPWTHHVTCGPHATPNPDLGPRTRTFKS